MTLPSLFLGLWFAAAAVVATDPALAGEGHDHGDAPAAATGSALPRFTAVSETFELVGVLDGQQLTLYLDRYADNSPVPAAQLELEIGGVKVPVDSDDDGAFTATLTEAPKPGVLPVTAVVIAGADTDLLAGELDIHDEAHADEAAHERGWLQIAAWVAAGVLSLVALFGIGRRLTAARAARAGGAA